MNTNLYKEAIELAIESIVELNQSSREHSYFPNGPHAQQFNRLYNDAQTSYKLARDLNPDTAEFATLLLDAELAIRSDRP